MNQWCKHKVIYRQYEEVSEEELNELCRKAEIPTRLEFIQQSLPLTEELEHKIRLLSFRTINKTYDQLTIEEKEEVDQKNKNQGWACLEDCPKS